MDLKASLPVIIRYAVTILGAFLVSRGYLDEEQLGFIADQTAIIVGAILAIGPLLYALWKRPSQKALEAAKKIDAELPASADVEIVTPDPKKPNIKVQA